jgi:hypothetical protein
MGAITEPDSEVAVIPSVMGKIREVNIISVYSFRALGIHKDHWATLFHSYSAFLAFSD